MKKHQVMVEMKKITKSFSGNLANDKVDFIAKCGEVHALLGENGAGKSTLMSALTGLYRPDSGEIRLRDKTIELKSPRDAIEHGIGMVHQHFKLVKPFTVTENIALGASTTPFLLNLDKVEAEIVSLAERFGLKVDPRAKIWQLSVGEQQRVEIIKMLYRGAEILILDEPTAVLTPQEVDDLFETLRQMANAGCAVIFITHKFREVMAGSDTITVLRNGQNVATVKTSETDQNKLAQLMVGREMTAKPLEKKGQPGEVVLKLDKVEAFNDKGLPALQCISTEIRAGEILGIAGVAGNGQRELAEVVTGLRETSGGKIMISGKDYTDRSPKEFISAGVAHVPEDRLGTGLVPNLTAVDNILLKDYRNHQGYFLDLKESRKLAEKMVEDFQIKLTSIDDPIKLMSGGNLQKMLLAREFHSEPKLIVAVYPVRGLDIGATRAVRQLLLEQREQGAAILLISEDLDELMELADKIAVMYEGEIMDILPPTYDNLEAIGLLMAGSKCEEVGA